PFAKLVFQMAEALFDGESAWIITVVAIVRLKAGKFTLKVFNFFFTCFKALRDLQMVRLESGQLLTQRSKLGCQGGFFNFKILLKLLLKELSVFLFIYF